MPDRCLYDRLALWLADRQHWLTDLEITKINFIMIVLLNDWGDGLTDFTESLTELEVTILTLL